MATNNIVLKKSENLIQVDYQMTREMPYIESNTFGYFIDKAKETQQKKLTKKEDEDEDCSTDKGNNWKIADISFTR